MRRATRERPQRLLHAPCGSLLDKNEAVGVGVSARPTRIMRLRSSAPCPPGELRPAQHGTRGPGRGQGGDEAEPPGPASTQ
eukprot:766922-Hanusia_phi.AAC.2